MKKFWMMILCVCVVLVGLNQAEAEELLGRKVFAMKGTFLEFIPFQFTAPTGCGNIRTYEYVPGYNYPTYTPAHWEEVEPGTQPVSYAVGIYKFVVSGGCSPEILLQGELNEMDLYGGWSGIEIEPEDVGLFVRGLGVLKNYFKLPTDDREFSYVAAFPPYGRKCSFDDLISYTSGGVGIRPSASNLVGVILPDQRGYMSKIIFSPKSFKRSIREMIRQAPEIILNDDQFVILVFEENY